ncbi:MAG: PAS domain S-box protein [Elusimicrobiota bacterium]|jgi:PAS domain S-box-containing protein
MTTKEQNQAKEALQKYEDLVNNLPIGIYRNTPGDNGRFLEANPATVAMFEAASKEEFMRHSVSELYRRPEQRKAFSDKLLRDGFIHGDVLELLTLKGRPIWVSITAVMKKNENGEIFFDGTLEDITERKLAQEALQDNEKKVRLLLDSITEGVYGVDLEGRCTFINRKGLQLLGYTDAHQLLGENLYSHIHHAQLNETPLPAKISRMLMALHEGRSTHTEEAEFWRADGSSLLVEYWSHPLLEGSRVVGMVTTFKDLTIRKEEERKRKLLTTALEQSSESIIITNAASTIIYVNPRFEQLTGYTSQEAVGQKPAILRSNRHDAAFYKQMWELLLNKKAWQGVFINRCKDGHLVEVEATLTPIIDEFGQIVNYVAVQRDITEKNRLQKIVRQTEKMSAIGTLAAGVAHEINNPLGIILGFSQAVMNRLQPSDPLATPIKSIEREATRCRNLVQDLLTFSRTTHAESEPMDLNKTIEGTLSLLQAQARLVNAQIQTNFATVLPRMTGNIKQIQQIVINLAKNAMDAMTEGGTVTISTSLWVDQPQSWVCLKVADTGSGISPDVLPKIFEPFFTTKPEGQGTGLGLSLIYEIVKKHSGLIDVQSHPGLTEFFIKFPAYTDKNA